MSSLIFDAPKVNTDKYEEKIGSSGTKEFSLIVKKQTEGKGYYGVRLVTGKASKGNTGLLSRAYFRLVGKKRVSQRVHILSGIEAGTYIDTSLKTKEELEDIQIVSIGTETNILKNTWFVQYAVVFDLKHQRSKEGKVFPCYRWIAGGESINITAKSYILKGIEANTILKAEREEQLTKKKTKYQWQEFPELGLPSGHKGTKEHLPRGEQFDGSKSMDFKLQKIKGVVATGVAGAFTSLKKPEGYSELLKHLDKKAVMEIEKMGRWTSDVEFGRQILNGVNPVVIKKCTELPPEFPVTNEQVEAFLTRGKTLEEEMEEGNVFICDLRIMGGVPTRQGHYVAAPICLLYVKASNQLVPIAIQLVEKSTIFFPTDTGNGWILAKTFYQSAHAQHHHISTHFLSCHAVMEAYSVATMRNLPDSHPVNRLLHPHLHYTIAINKHARSALVKKGGIFDKVFSIGGEGRMELFRKVAKSYSINETNIKKSVEERGVGELPGYYYRDDGVKIFEALEEYVTNVLGAFYEGDEDVEADGEIQAWAKDLHTNGFPGYFGGEQGHDFPEQIATKDELTEICTAIIFTGSAHHAATNYGQSAIYGFVPNAPFAMRKDPRAITKMSDDKDLMAALPDKDTAKLSINVAFTLSQFDKDEVFLGNFPSTQFEQEIRTHMNSLQEKLREIAREIEERNRSLEVPYTFMLPSKIPNSVTV